MPKVFTKSEIPATMQDTPQPGVVKKWPHLKQIADCIHPIIPHAKIGLLIGTNCPKAIEPKDVVPSKNGGPFAIQTFAGWTQEVESPGGWYFNKIVLMLIAICNDLFQVSKVTLKTPGGKRLCK